MPKMPEMPNIPNPFATAEIESKLTSIQDAMTKMENKMDEVDKKVTDLSTKPEPSSVSVPTPEDTGGIFGSIGNMFGNAAPASTAPASTAPDVPAAPVPAIEDTSTIPLNPVKEENASSVFDIFSSTDAVTQPPAPIPINPTNPIPANPIVAEIPQINDELAEKVNIENPFNEPNEPDLNITPSIEEEEPINQPMAPPPPPPLPLPLPLPPPPPLPPPQFGQPIGGKTRKRRKYKRRKSKKVNLPIE
jgi:hypothetical protein